MRQVAVLALVTALAATPVRGEGNYGPLSAAQYNAFVVETMALGRCMVEMQAQLGEQGIAARIVAAGNDGPLLAQAAPLLADEPAYASALAQATDPARKVRITLASLEMRDAMRADDSIPDTLRRRGLLARYRSVAAAPKCQPSPEFLSSLKVLLDENH